jgi:DNA-binding PadR family transcriptional regulator
MSSGRPPSEGAAAANGAVTADGVVTADGAVPAEGEANKEQAGGDAEQAEPVELRERTGAYPRLADELRGPWSLTGENGGAKEPGSGSQNHPAQTGGAAVSVHTQPYLRRAPRHLTQCDVMTQRPLNATAASLLGFLHTGPKTGWDLVATAQRQIGDFWSITQSQVYRELAAMAQAGLVEAGEREVRDRRPYAITAAGRKAFAAWVEQPPGPELIRFPLLLTVVFGAHMRRETLAAHVAAHRRIHADRLAEYEAQRAAAEAAPRRHRDPYALASLDFGLRYERAVLEWFDALPKEIRG